MFVMIQYYRTIFDNQKTDGQIYGCQFSAFEKLVNSYSVPIELGGTCLLFAGSFLDHVAGFGHRNTRTRAIITKHHRSTKPDRMMVSGNFTLSQNKPIIFGKDFLIQADMNFIRHPEQTNIALQGITLIRVPIMYFAH